jgi:hypothetical protein
VARAPMQLDAPSATFTEGERVRRRVGAGS